MSSITPRPYACPDCRGGRVGMTDCQTCAQTGVVFKVNGRTFPDTREGYIAAEAELMRGVAIDYGSFCE